MSVTKEQCVSCGVPAHLADQAEVAGVSWLSLLMLAAKYGPVLYAIIHADLAAGKPFAQIIADLLAATGLQVTP